MKTALEIVLKERPMHLKDNRPQPRCNQCGKFCRRNRPWGNWELACKCDWAFATRPQ